MCTYGTIAKTLQVQNNGICVVFSLFSMWLCDTYEKLVLIIVNLDCCYCCYCCKCSCFLQFLFIFGGNSSMLKLYAWLMIVCMNIQHFYETHANKNGFSFGTFWDITKIYCIIDWVQNMVYIFEVTCFKSKTNRKFFFIFYIFVVLKRSYR